MNKELAKNFLNKELADLAKVRNDSVVPEQSFVSMADVAKVKVTNTIKHAPSR
jgi:hypothetical protein